MTRNKGANRALTLNHKAKGNRLHATGRGARRNQAREEWRELVTDKPIKDTTRLLGVNQIEVNPARVAKGVKDRPLRDLAEGDAAPIRLWDLQRFGKVPGDRLPFTIKVGSEPDRLRTLCGAANIGETPLLLLNDLVVRSEAVLHIHRQAAEPLRRLRRRWISLLPLRTLRRNAPLRGTARLLREIANMAVGGDHAVIGT